MKTSTALVRAAAMIFLLFAPALLLAERNPFVNGVDTSKWHGFNLLEKFTLEGNSRYREKDFRLMRELGFNFVRLPIDYRCYANPADWLAFDERKLREIDEAVAYGKEYGIHVCLNLHRAPGYCINPPAEPRDLWTDPQAQTTFITHWKMFATRYRGIPASAFSFNLVNEPYGSTEERYLDLLKRTIAAICAIDPDASLAPGADRLRLSLRTVQGRPTVSPHHIGRLSGGQRAGHLRSHRLDPLPAQGRGRRKNRPR
jgi:endoglucanase